MIENRLFFDNTATQTEDWKMSRRKKRKLATVNKALVPARVDRRIAHDSLFIQVWRLTYFGHEVPLKKYMNLCPMFWRVILLGPLALVLYGLFYSGAALMALATLVGQGKLNFGMKTASRSNAADGPPPWFVGGIIVFGVFLWQGEYTLPGLMSLLAYLYHSEFVRILAVGIICLAGGATLLASVFIGVVKLLGAADQKIRSLSYSTQRRLFILAIGNLLGIVFSLTVFFWGAAIVAWWVGFIGLMITHYILSAMLIGGSLIWWYRTPVWSYVDLQASRFLENPKVEKCFERLDKLIDPVAECVSNFLAGYRAWRDEQEQIKMKKLNQRRLEREAKQALRGQGSWVALRDLLKGLYKEYCPIWEVVR
jgi:hypothetical protein